ncbi:hypothetical protein KCMC57_up62110 [Kitasatospora sp. CMC57]|uniref:Uncharacterized protein n=1 Tax=Kitasatospora sp. CMC57 TaxID=3231513 RepID=A0AB33K834_9ACTN
MPLPRSAPVRRGAATPAAPGVAPLVCLVSALLTSAAVTWHALGRPAERQRQRQRPTELTTGRGSPVPRLVLDLLGMGTSGSRGSGTRGGAPVRCGSGAPKGNITIYRPWAGSCVRHSS